MKFAFTAVIRSNTSVNVVIAPNSNRIIPVACFLVSETAFNRRQRSNTMAPSRTKTSTSAKPTVKTVGPRVDSAGFRAKFLERALIEWHAEQLTKLEATAAQRRGVLAKVKEEANRVEAARRKEEQAATKLYRKDVATRQAIVAEAEERQVRVGVGLRACSRPAESRHAPAHSAHFLVLITTVLKAVVESSFPPAHARSCNPAFVFRSALSIAEGGEEPGGRPAAGHARGGKRDQGRQQGRAQGRARAHARAGGQDVPCVTGRGRGGGSHVHVMGARPLGGPAQYPAPLEPLVV